MTNGNVGGALIAAIELGENIRIERHACDPTYILKVRGFPDASCVDWVDLIEEFERRCGSPKIWQWFMLRNLGDYEVTDE